jgi:hypothetical protein
MRLCPFRHLRTVFVRGQIRRFGQIQRSFLQAGITQWQKTFQHFYIFDPKPKKMCFQANSQDTTEENFESKTVIIDGGGGGIYS